MSSWLPIPLPEHSPPVWNLGPWTLLSVLGSSADPRSPLILGEPHPCVSSAFPVPTLHLAYPVFTSSPRMSVPRWPPSLQQCPAPPLKPSSIRHPNPHPLSFPSPQGLCPHPLTSALPSPRLQASPPHSALGSRIRHHRCFFAAPAAPWSRLFPLRANLARAWLEGDCRPDRLPRSRDRGPLSILCCAAGWPPARKPPLPDQEGLPLPTASETLSCFPQKPPELPSPHPCDALCPPPPLPAHCPALGCSLGS